MPVESQIIANAIPFPQTDVVGQEVSGDDCVGESKNPTANLKIEFPVGGENYLLAGGCTVSFSRKVDDSKFYDSNNKEASSKKIESILSKEISSITLIQNLGFLEKLTTFRNNINGAIKSAAKKESLRRKLKLPKIFISTFLGDDSEFSDKTDQGIPGVIKVCELKYVPFEIFNSENFKEQIGLLGDNYGVAGKSFLEYKDWDILDKVLEFFPIYNISENDIVKRGLNVTNGGYYTIDLMADESEQKIYFKMPDLSGKNSFGFAPDIFENRNFYIEILSENKLQRIKLENISVPPSIDISSDIPSEWPEEGSLELSIESNKEISEVYLSPILLDKPSVDEITGIKTYPDGTEIYSLPLLTKPIDTDNSRSPTISLEDIYEDKKIVIGNQKNYLNESTGDIFDEDFIDREFTDSNINKIGIANGSEFLFIDKKEYGNSINFKNQSTFFGEKNRPEIILFSQERKKPLRSNNRKYSSVNIFEARNLFAGTRPKIYGDVPLLWIKGTVDSTDSATGDLNLKFSSEEIKKINKESSNLQFVLYAKDSDGQLGRAPFILTFEISKPEIDVLSPDGFDGSPEISPVGKRSISIRGQKLRNVSKVKFTALGTEDFVILDKGVNDDYSLIVSSNNIEIIPFVQWNQIGLTPTTQYEVSLISDKSGTPKLIYVSDGDNNKISKGPQVPDLSADGLFKFLNGKTTSEIPIIYRDNSILKIKCSEDYFNGDYILYSYIMSDKNIFEDIEVSGNIKEAKLDGTTYYIPSSIEYEFSDSISANFYKISNKKAGLKIPGDGYQDRNFSSLISKSQDNNFYLLITNNPLEQVLSEGTILDKDYFSVNIDSPAFIGPPTIIGMVGEVGGDFISTSSELIKDDYKEIFGSKPEFGNISVFNKLTRLAIVFNCDDDNNINKRTKFYLGGDRLDGGLISSKIEKIKDNIFYVIFSNIKKKETGDFTLYIEKKYKEYGVESSSEDVDRFLTFKLSDFEFNPDDGSISIEERFPVLDKQSDYPLESLIPPSGSGTSAFKAQNQIVFKNNVNLISNVDINLSDGIEEFSLIRNRLSDEISSLDSQVLYIPGGTKIPSGVYEKYESSEANVFLNLNIKKPHTISFNKGKLIGIASGTEVISSPNIVNNELPDNIKLIPKENYSILATSADKKFSVILTDKSGIQTRIKPTKVKKNKDIENQYTGIISIPKNISKDDGCPKIGISTTNVARDGSKIALGPGFVADISKRINSIVGGQIKVKVPDLDELKDILSNFPLILPGPIRLEDVSIPSDLIQSFCDMSFHLTADLKIALNGFQILLVPIQIIFCIIDVICALINPVKLAKAVIRLFQCLYDLVLLLPQISVPVMLISLLLHLLRLLECVLNKVLFMVNLVNEIIKAIQNAEGAWQTIVALEEVLSQYLLEIKTDLSVLDPIVSILSIFLQILGLTFRFPCSITDAEDEFFCMDGTMLAGLVIGKIANTETDSENNPITTFNFENILPVAQSYTDTLVEDALPGGNSEDLIDPTDGLECAEKSSETTYLESMDVDQTTLRSTYADSTSKFNLTFGASITKSKKGQGSPDLVKFIFKEKGRNGAFVKKKNIDPNQTLDAPIFLTKSSSNKLTVETGSGKNIISPIDGEKFLNINGDTASVKPLVLNINIEVVEENPETGEPEVVGVESVPRTFDNIPKMAIVDEEFSGVYFIEKDGIELEDGAIKSIVARVVNMSSAEKKKFLKEDVEVDTDDDGTEDDEARVFEFPQIYFVDMRSVAEDIETKCNIDFFNNDLLNEDPDDIIDIVEETQDCIETYTSYISNTLEKVRSSMEIGEVPEPIDVEESSAKGEELEECIEDLVDKICIFVVNSLNTQFKILEDNDETELEDYVSTDLISEDLADDFEIAGPSVTGAREYAGGIGDSAEIFAESSATIQITPRDSYDEPVPGDLTEKILLEITSDTTGSAEILSGEDGIFTKIGNDYFAKVRASSPGIVKLRAKVCNKTVQAVTYSEISSVITEDDESLVDCVPEAEESPNNEQDGALGALTKVDRILTIFFKNKLASAISDIEDGNIVRSVPQEFGTSLEN